jgi:hypothetical protein
VEDLLLLSTSFPLLQTHAHTNTHRERERERERVITLAPFFVEPDDLVDDLDVGKTTPLRFPDEIGIAALLYSEQINVQHSLSVSVSVSVCLQQRKRSRKQKQVLHSLNPSYEKRLCLGHVARLPLPWLPLLSQ